MPSSRPCMLDKICNIFINTSPSSILDIGCGFGKFGFLAREYTDIWGGDDRYWSWEVQIDAIEIYEKYILPHHRIIYNNIYIGNVLDILPVLQNYDMIICSDMVEHLSKNNGHKLLTLISHKSSIATITTPIGDRPQDEIYGNEYEKHISSWSKEELEQYGSVIEQDGICLLLVGNREQ